MSPTANAPPLASTESIVRGPRLLVSRGVGVSIDALVVVLRMARFGMAPPAPGTFLQATNHELFKHALELSGGMDVVPENIFGGSS